MNIHVSNLSRETTEKELGLAFADYGTVSKTNIIADKTTKVSKGFGFVEMLNETEAKAAIKGMSGRDMHGHDMVVSEARGNTENGVATSSRAVNYQSVSKQTTTVVAKCATGIRNGIRCE